MSPFALVTSGIVKAEELAGCNFLDLVWVAEVLPHRIVGLAESNLDFFQWLPSGIVGLFDFFLAQCGLGTEACLHSCTF
jgi:hypothetical protein